MDVNEYGSIDLYADDGDASFSDEYKESLDIYDDVIAAPILPSIKQMSPTAKTNGKQVDSNETGDDADAAPKTVEKIGRYQLYVGNLTWWTKDEDLFKTIFDMGIKDCLEIKFFENRINGQSKGFCVVTLKSELSAKACLEKLPLQELFGRKPVVTNPTKQALNMFESQSKTRPAPQANMNRQYFNGGSSMYNSMSKYSNHYGHMMPPPSFMYSCRGMRPYFNSSYPDMRFNRCDWNRSYPRHCSPFSQNTYSYNQFRGYGNGKSYSRHESRSQNGNSESFSPGHNSMDDSEYGQLVVPDWMDSDDPSYAEAIYERILHNNRKISSSAMARAISEMASGDFRSAVDTLQTALAVIRQSEAADDDRCKILISSLQDTLISVENKGIEKHSSRSRNSHQESNISPDR